jgi:hypothetical protein
LVLKRLHPEAMSIGADPPVLKAQAPAGWR